MFSNLSVSVPSETSIGLKLFDDVFYSQTAVCKKTRFPGDLTDENDTSKKQELKRQNVTHWHESGLTRGITKVPQWTDNTGLSEQVGFGSTRY